jgi:hypothetical protein
MAYCEANEIDFDAEVDMAEVYLDDEKLEQA